MATATDTRQELSQLAEQQGWQRNEHDRVDVYLRGRYRAHAIWRDAAVLNGGALYEDGILLSYSRDLAKVQGWLGR